MARDNLFLPKLRLRKMRVHTTHSSASNPKDVVKVMVRVKVPNDNYFCMWYGDHCLLYGIDISGEKGVHFWPKFRPAPQKLQKLNIRVFSAIMW